jgi:nicotinamidase/pyrazinamidase
MTSALIVVDMQNGFLREGNLASKDNAASLPAVVDEVESALSDGRRVIFTADTHEVDDREFEIFPEHCLRGSTEAELVDELQGYLAHDLSYLLPKRRYSAMFETELQGLLSRHDIDDVRICGVCTDICVLHTTSDLRNRDIPVTVAAPATATFDAPGHPTDETKEWALSHMQQILGATIDRG